MKDGGRGPVSSKRPWSVDRWGRLLAGIGILLSTALGLFHHPGWLAGTLLASCNLVVTSLTGRCPLHDLLIRLGAKEREDLYLPGGLLRPEAQAHSPSQIPEAKVPLCRSQRSKERVVGIQADRAEVSA